jgi:hypothetical protein
MRAFDILRAGNKVLAGAVNVGMIAFLYLNWRHLVASLAFPGVVECLRWAGRCYNTSC